MKILEIIVPLVLIVILLACMMSKEDGFSVAIIPYTYEHTNFNSFEVGTIVNLEFDVIGKYVARLHGVR